MKYINVKQIMEFAPVSQSKAYEIFHAMLDEFKKEYPEEQKKIEYLFGLKIKVIPDWYFNEKFFVLKRA